ncbi:MAG TPA: HAD family hydrolase [Rhodospirillaceae bacterium]|nr:HAD family hydrolase [Rhodospirillaceae bacterium]
MKNKGLLLDRDGVINEDHGYVGTIERFSLKIEGFPFLRMASDKGYRLAIVTNQSGIARGYYTQDDFDALTNHMCCALKEEGIIIDLVLSCAVHPDSVAPELKRMSYWRKPNAGMILEAALKLDLDLSRSIMLGDRQSDVQAAVSAKVGRVLWLDEKKEASAEEVVIKINTFSEAKRFLI